MCARLADRMRERRLTFGGRLLCPFLRPFFLDAADEARVHASPRRCGRSASASRGCGAGDRRRCCAARRSARTRSGWRTSIPATPSTSTAARADAFLLPDSLQFAEYNAESPAGAGYSQRLAELFAEEPLMRAFRERFDARIYPPIEQLLEALLASYRDWGGTASPPRIAIVDWREVPTWSEFEILRDAFIAAGRADRDLRSARPRSSTARTSARRRRSAIDLVYRRVLINDIVARADECRALVDAYRGARRLRRQHAALQDPAQEGVLRRAHRRRYAACSAPRSAT